ncbi:MAG: thermonuclease family protein [Bacteroidales bacterium]|nr:thermonuclease family protein [Bacteroidales bacterium]
MLIIGIVLLLFQSPEYTGTIIHVTDGDTFVLQCEQGSIKIRMDGIDAPEKDQPFGSESTNFMKQYLYKKSTVKTNGVDRYGRTIGTLYVDGININLLSVQKGYSWHFKKYSSDPELSSAEVQAKKEKKGLWEDPDAIAPWEWRKLNSK